MYFFGRHPVSLALLALAIAAAPARGADAPIDFNRQIRPILSNNCFRCHGPDQQQRAADLRLDSREDAVAEHDSGITIVPHKPDQSVLVERINSDDPYERMPPADSGNKLTPAEKRLLAKWIEQGAPYARHWSYVKPARVPIPATKNRTWAKNNIDRFLLERMEREGLSPSPEADRYALVRRISLDLTGLPPTPEQVKQFVEDKQPQAYERLVERLLATPAYGEHWARMWLDLARYADSAGYAEDNPRTIWMFRDYVIRSLNANKPFDQFTIEQIAGDLLPGATEEQQIATAFHRNTLTNSEGGTDDEEFRNEAVVDRVNTTMAVWMGTTMACAQCHDHKYDPISQEDYFRFFAILNNTADSDKPNESPLLRIYSESQRAERRKLSSEIARLEAKLNPSESPAATATATDTRVTADEKTAPNKKATQDKIAALKKELAAIEPTTTVPVMRELAKPRPTHIQHRGNFLDKGREVTAGVPSTFHPLAADAKADRLALARWLVNKENPLTARVIANRYWEAIFGIGLVRSSEEFGSQGDLPVNQDLLDYLANDLMDHGWDIQYLIKQLVLSAAYRQSSRVTPALLEADPDNRLLARGPRFRLSAEMVRDQALAVSGLLSSKMYGPPVNPPQPNMGLKAAFGGKTDWKTSDGEDRYRRALYTSWRRSSPYPSMAAFDAPNREVCTVRRDRTNTPIQALVTLNDPVYLEAAQSLARRTVRSASSTEERAVQMFRLCLTRMPTAAERDRLVKLYAEALKKFQQDREGATRFATEPLGPAPQDTDVATLAAWTVVGNVMLNLDEMFMKR